MSDYKIVEEKPEGTGVLQRLVQTGKSWRRRTRGGADATATRLAVENPGSRYTVYWGSSTQVFQLKKR